MRTQSSATPEGGEKTAIIHQNIGPASPISYNSLTGFQPDRSSGYQGRMLSYPSRPIIKPNMYFLPSTSFRTHENVNENFTIRQRA